MSERPRRLVDRLVEPDFLADVTSITTAELREIREKCDALDAEYSYTRRLLQGKLDIIKDALQRRADGGDPGIRDLVKRLPEILGEGAPGSGGRHLRVLVPPNADIQRREVERIASDASLAQIGEMSAAELSELMDRVAEAEVKVSEKRRQILQASDLARAELVRRYKEGLEDPEELLTSP